MPTDLTTAKHMEQCEIERSFIVQAWRFPLYTTKTCGWLRPSIFLDVTARRFWASLISSVAPSMTDEEAAAAATSAAIVADIEGDLMKWANDTPQGSMPEAYANEVVRRSYIHNASLVLPDLLSAIGDADDKKIRGIVSKLKDVSGEGSLSIKTSLEVAERFAEVVTAGDRVIKTYTPIDKAIGGFEKQTEIVLAARTSMGKTAMAWQIARCVSASGKKVAFFSLEMSTTALWARAACPAADLAWRDVLGGNITEDEKEILVNEAMKLGRTSQETLFIDDTPKTTDDIWRSVMSLSPDLVVVDHLRLLKDDTGDNEVRRLGYCSERLRDIAKASNIPVLVVAQLSRAPEYRAEKRPQLSDLRESGHIEENADVILMMYRDDYYNPTLESEMSETSFTEVFVRKFRDGPATTKVEFLFDKAREWFEPAN